MTATTMTTIQNQLAEYFPVRSNAYSGHDKSEQRLIKLAHVPRIA
jgi:hypothetical protein